MNISSPSTRSRHAVVLLCFLTIVADGYDLIIYGAAVPELLDERGWELTAGQVGAIASWTLFGLLIGFLGAGPLTDRIGRRRIMMIGVVWFSIGSLLSALAPTIATFGIARFLTGIGIGAVVPSAVALTAEYAPERRRQLYNGLMLTGYSVGGILSALSAMLILPSLGWRALFGIASIFIVLAVVMYFLLPESVHNLADRGRLDEAQLLASRYGIDPAEIQPSTQPEDRGYRQLRQQIYLVPLVLFVIVCLCVNIVVYGLNTWLPELMRHAGYNLGSALAFLFVLQLGAVLGTVGGSFLADRLGSARVIIGLIVIGVVSLLVLSQDLSTGWLMVAVAGAGAGGTGTSSLTYGFIASRFPSSCRGSAVGVSMGLGRVGSILGPMVGAWVLGLGIAYQWSFYAFAIPAVIAAIVIAIIGRGVRRTDSATGSQRQEPPVTAETHTA